MFNDLLTVSEADSFRKQRRDPRFRGMSGQSDGSPENESAPVTGTLT